MAVTDFQKFMDDQLHKATGYIGVSHSSGSSKASSSSSKASAFTPTLAGAKPAQAPTPSFNTTPRMTDASQASQLKGVEDIMRTAVNAGITYKMGALAQDGNLKQQQLDLTEKSQRDSAALARQQANRDWISSNADRRVKKGLALKELRYADKKHAREIGLKGRTTLTAGQQYSLGQLPYATQKETKRMELESAKTLKQMDLENSRNLAQFNMAGNILTGLVTKGNNYSYLGSV